MLTASLLLMFGCADQAGSGPLAPDSPPPGSNPSAQVSLDVQPALAEVEIGETMQLSANLTDGNGTPLDGFSVTWSSDDPPVAEVDDAGLVL
ncbi:MAG: Ig-like domain-containing protein, partial [Gemmatimonadota bacterium]|nr:Ig-like domain-containing protein [Gemmatimonadota bacterium]